MINPKNFTFAWDDEKNISNFEKHGYYLSFAVKIFFDKKSIYRFDEEHPEEERYNLIGKFKNIFFVVYTFRNKNIIRIISIRRANMYGKARYIYGDDSWS